jgi:hypothetical protein
MVLFGPMAWVSWIQLNFWSFKSAGVMGFKGIYSACAWVYVLALKNHSQAFKTSHL